FNKYQVTAKPFFATDSCISCGLCEKACPVHNIRVVDKPVWGEFCTSCLACYHVCPQQAVQYGKATRNKHQYFNPHQ
ncbi:EFR1 family ferrodoxin, partial [Macellibacteroides fermentans]